VAQGPVEPTIAQLYARQNPDASIEEAFTAGYTAGVQRARADMKPRRRSEPTLNQSVEARQLRTISAALELFRDQILATNPDEVATGEWCSASEVTGILARLRQEEGALV